MRQIFIFVVLIALIVGGVWWFLLSGRSEPEPAPLPMLQTSSAPEETPTDIDDGGEAVQSPQDGGTGGASQSEESAREPTPKRKPQYLFDASGWLHDYRDGLASLSVLLAMARVGRVPGAGEETPDPAKIQRDLHERLADVDLPPEQERLSELLHKLDRDFEEIVNGLSDPPLPGELELTMEKRRAIEPKLKEIDGIIASESGR